MVNGGGLNRRKFPRVNFPCLVVIRKSQDKDDAILTHTENVGIGGVGVALKQDLKIFCPLEIELDLLDLQEHIKCKGKVVWSVRRKNEPEPCYDIGIEFMNLDTQAQKRIENAVTHLANQKIISQ